MGNASARGPLDAVIVGAGFAGLYLIHKLRSQGLRIRAYEMAGDVGGTWYWNRYPGARCDQESLYYSYSFDPQLEQDWEWSERYATQPEILGYLNHVADRLDLRREIQFNTEVRGADFDEAANVWKVQVGPDQIVEARFLIMATGCLSAPLEPHVDGQDSFDGRVLFTARWPHEPVDFTGRRVAVIGTGSSGIQTIPMIAPDASQLTVFQRTPSFALPARNAPLDPEHVETVKRHYPEVRKRMRESGFGSPAVTVPTESALDVDQATRDEAYAKAYDYGHLGALMQTYRDLFTNAKANETAAEFVRSRILARVSDPETARKLVPRGYPLGTKRPCLETDYFETFNRPNVSLVSLRDTPIIDILPLGIRTSQAVFPVDDIIFATGFDAITGSLLRIPLRGLQGHLLAEAWREGPRSFLGVAVSGFPNLFTITGPGSPSVLSNVVVSIEQHVEWICDCISYMSHHAYDRVDVDPQAQGDWMVQVAEAAGRTLYTGTASWYTGANVPGKPAVFMPYIGGVGTFRKLCDEVAAAGYPGLAMSRSAAVSR